MLFRSDQLLCINREDYRCAKKTFHSKYINYIPGVGIDLTRISGHDETFLMKKKADLGLPTDKIIILSSGELIKRKNHETAIRTMAWLQEQKYINTPDRPPVHYVICGHGKLENELKQLVDALGIPELVTFAGYREDMLDIYQIADIFLFPSYQEGLPMSLLEAMACGLPVVCSDIRGCRDLMGNVQSENGNFKVCPGGYMVNHANSIEDYGYALLQLLTVPERLKGIGEKNKYKSREFSIEAVELIMKKIYCRLLTDT